MAAWAGIVAREVERSRWIMVKLMGLAGRLDLM